MTHATKILAAAVALLVSAPVLAGNERPKDTNNDGKIDVAEAQAAHPGYTKDQLDKADANRDGILSDEELAALPGEGHHYGAMDSNNDGNYTLDEVRATHPNLTQEEYAGWDVNKDGKVTKDELKMMTDKPRSE